MWSILRLFLSRQMNTRHSPITQSDTPGDPTCHLNLPLQSYSFFSSTPLSLRKQLAPFDVWLAAHWVTFTAASDRVSIQASLGTLKSFSVWHHDRNSYHGLPVLLPNTWSVIALMQGPKWQNCLDCDFDFSLWVNIKDSIKMSSPTKTGNCLLFLLLMDNSSQRKRLYYFFFEEISCWLTGLEQYSLKKKVIKSCGLKLLS